jgi:hypothetical protein
MTRGFVRLSQVVLIAALVTFVLASASSGRVTGNARVAALRLGEVPPNHHSMVDCNGWSPQYRSVKQSMQMLCVDPISVANGTAHRFNDNGWYIGHDEPSTKFISSAHGSGNHFTYYMKLAKDPSQAPKVNGLVTDYAELSVAPWFGLPICDANSYPQNPCTPDSDTNSGGITDPHSAGSAFMELQFYAPGFGPWIDGPSCDPTRYCAALNIDSLMCTNGFSFCNPNCEEPVNFAWIQRDGIPAGPPSPQEADESTFSPNNETLMMNQGDSLQVSVSDSPSGVTILIKDLTTGQTGTMVASAANGFMNTDINTCGGTPFNFHAEYDTASQPNQVPWAALEGGVLMEDELGHFESCDSVTSQLGISGDPQTYQECVGGNERNNRVTKGQGEGPCSFSTAICQGATTEGGVACPSNSFISGLPCEFGDAICIPAGPRPVEVNGQTSTWSWPIAGCEDNYFQNGDLDFDGVSYINDWPDGSSHYPSSFVYAGPFDGNGHTYPNIQFETDIGGSEIDCNTSTGAGCTALPHGASFYPFWTIGVQSNPTGFPSAPAAGTCLWNFGNDIAGVTTQDFGKNLEYGTSNVARYGGTLISPVMSNPQLDPKCKGA